MPRKTTPRKTAARKTRTGVTLATVRKLALALPGVEEGTSYGTPAFRVRKKLFARINDAERALVLRCPPAARELLMQAKPDVFFITDHYRDYPYVLARLATVDPADLAQALREAWHESAPPRLRASLDT